MKITKKKKRFSYLKKGFHKIPRNLVRACRRRSEGDLETQRRDPSLANGRSPAIPKAFADFRYATHMAVSPLSF